MTVLEGLYSELVESTQAHLKESQISAKMFRSHLSKLDLHNKLLHREFLNATLPKITKHSSFDDIWDSFCSYSSFLNSSLLEHVIKRLGDTRLVDRLEDYKGRLGSFRSTARVKDLSHYITNLKGLSLSEQRLKRFVIKWKKSWDSCLLEELEQSKENITERFFIPTNFISMLEAEKGSIVVTWAIPDFIASTIQENLDRADVVEFCKTETIISMKVEGRECNYLQTDSKITFTGMI